jgi:beta-N-acetylhexosaminidase
VHTNPDNPVIGNRAFGRTPEDAAAHALAFWRGLRAAGVLGCGKHFPGHGDTRTDSHHDLPVVPHDEPRLRGLELVPFAAAIAAGIEALMTAHVVYPALDPQRPATFSPAIATTLLRDQLAFRGLLVSDDLGMRAVADRWSIEELVVEGLLAGLDHFLIRGPTARQEAAWEALVHAAEARADVRARVEEGAARVATFKTLARVGPPLEGEALLSRLGTTEHLALAASFPRLGSGSVAASPVAGR